MLGQRMETPVLTSQTLPKLDGQDEEGDHLVEGQFEMLCATNSCPDLSVLEEEHLSTLEDSKNEGFETVIRRGGVPHTSNRNVDIVDGIFIKHTQPVSVTSNSNAIVPSKIPLGFRRSTSLNSLGVDQDFGSRGEPHPTACIHPDNLDPGGFARVRAATCGAGAIENISAQLDIQLKQIGESGMKCPPMHSATDFYRSKLRASDSGRPGYLHKSVSSPSVSQQFPTAATQSSGLEHIPHHQRQKSSTSQNYRSTSQSDAHQHSSKRSFFRRKKFKGHSMNTHGQSSAALHSFDTGTMMNMNGSSVHSNHLSGAGGFSDDHLSESSLGLAALTDPSLGLQDADAECWAPSMSPNLIASMEEREVKRQEHMYEFILTEKHHCLTLALMHHLFIGDMKKNGFSRQARLIFPDLKFLLQVHFNFLRKLRERQATFRKLNQPMDTISDILMEQFSGSQWQLMLRFYGLLCASHNQSLDIIKTLQKEPKFASLYASWSKEPMLARKNVQECLLFVAQRITKYPLLIEPLVNKSSASHQEKELLSRALRSSKELNHRVNERVAERHTLLEICQKKIDPKSYVMIGQKRRGREDLMSVPGRRLLFQGQAIVTCNRIGVGTNPNVPCSVYILTDCIVFTQDSPGGRQQFVSPPGIVMLSNLLVRPNAGHHKSMFLVISDSGMPGMIEVHVQNPDTREVWMEKIKEAKNKYEEKPDAFSDVDDDSSDAVDHSEVRTAKALEELQENDKQILALLKSRSKIIDILRADKPQNWVTCPLDGKENVMSAMSAACNEVRQMINHIDANHVNVVNRSTSCVGEIGASSVHNNNANALQGLPRRADTFGGFDSQQRGGQGDQLSSSSSSSSSGVNINNRQLLEMVVQLEDVCGELFSLLVHQMSPIVYQNYYQLQRRMEDLREAQQRLETEKAIWQQEFHSQKENIDKDKNDLSSWKSNLQKEQDDITQQREQLYRKLEAMQRNPCNCNWKGLVPTPDSISPGSSGGDKPNQSALPRRPSSNPIAGAHQAAGGSGKAKQQLPMHLASFSASKGGGPGGGISTSSLGSSVGLPLSNEPPPLLPKPRSSVLSSFKSSKSASSLVSNSNSQHNNAAQTSWAQPSVKNTSSSSQVQQLLPLRLSEGLASSSTTPKTSSLPRGVTASRSASSVNQPDHSEPPVTTAIRYQRLSGAGNSYNFTDQPPNQSFLHGPVASGNSERMHGYISKPALPLPPQNHPHYLHHHHQQFAPSAHQHQTNGGGGQDTTGVPNPIIHRRSGSSPVPMSATSSVATNARTHHHHHHHHSTSRFFQPQDEDFDSSKILFL